MRIIKTARVTSVYAPLITLVSTSTHTEHRGTISTAAQALSVKKQPCAKVTSTISNSASWQGWRRGRGLIFETINECSMVLEHNPQIRLFANPLTSSKPCWKYLAGQDPSVVQDYHVVNGECLPLPLLPRGQVVVRGGGSSLYLRSYTTTPRP
ncbi:hypothetical protein BT63DRAFT_325566 [Microthyrium microscopicum]|uniref:Uncharacterized protein n=1 Tax=Microthyrium microscopicum TaxID=703497 RepID=A0A6A6U6N9_9PEZI|nr:hypothetical protein BT63DRAFT_325566 [Microthyrium microscopicum]